MRRTRVLAAITAIPTLLLAGCDSPARTGVRDDWRVAGQKLDLVAAHVDAFGSLSVSDLILIENDGRFGMGDYGRDLSEYVRAAREGTDATVRRTEQQSEARESSLKLGADVEALLGAFGVTLVSPASAAKTPAPVGSGDGPKAEDAFTSAKFSELLAAAPTPGALSERRALILGLDDKLSERALATLLDPSPGEGRRVYVGVLQCSCVPGSRTQTGYAGEVSLTGFFARSIESAEALPEAATQPLSSKHSDNVPPQPYRGPGWERVVVPDESDDPDAVRPMWATTRGTTGRQPFMLAAFPSSEAQVIDERQSWRDQVTKANLFAAALAFRGLDAQAETFRSFARRLENDVATRTALPFVTATTAGNTVTFQMRPRLEAVGDPAARSGGAANVLRPINFPALILVVVDDDLVDDGQNIAADRDTSQQSVARRNHSAPKYSHLELLVNTRWIPLRGAQPGSEHERLRVVEALEDVHSIASGTASKDGQRPPAEETRREIERRYRLYSSQARGHRRYTLLPPRPKPAATLAITSVHPKVGWTDAATELLVQGDGFQLSTGDPVVQRVLIGGVECPFKVLSDKVLVATVPAGSFPAPPKAKTTEGAGSGSTPDLGSPVIVVSRAGAVISSDRVAFTTERSRSTGSKPPGVALSRDGNGRLLGITVQGSEALGADKLLEAIRSVLESEVAASRISLDVSASSSASTRAPGTADKNEASAK